MLEYMRKSIYNSVILHMTDSPLPTQVLPVSLLPAFQRMPEDNVFTGIYQSTWGSGIPVFGPRSFFWGGWAQAT